MASKQFDEVLHRLPDHLIKSEFEARKRLQRSLSTATTLELAMFSHPEVELVKVAIKSMMTSLRLDLNDFIVARRKCRRHALGPATIRYEPEKLIKAPIWGAGLFSSASVKTTLEAAEKEGRSLCDRWGIYHGAGKRKSQEFSGPQPKNTPHKRTRGAMSTWHQMPRLPKTPKQQRVPTLMLQAVTPSGSGQQHQLVVVEPQQSQAFKKSSEVTSFRGGYNQGQQRGGRARGNRRRYGRGRDSDKSRQDKNPTKDQSSSGN